MLISNLLIILLSSKGIGLDIFPLLDNSSFTELIMAVAKLIASSSFLKILHKVLPNIVFSSILPAYVLTSHLS